MLEIQVEWVSAVKGARGKKWRNRGKWIVGGGGGEKRQCMWCKWRTRRKRMMKSGEKGKKEWRDCDRG